MAKYTGYDGKVDYGWQSNYSGAGTKQQMRAAKREVEAEKKARAKLLHDESVKKYGETLTFVNEWGCAVVFLVVLFIGLATGEVVR